MKLFQILKSSKEYLELKGFEKTIIYYRRGELSHYREFFIIDNEHAFCVWHDGMAGESGLEEFKEYESWVNLTK